jgi:hypothetical protein
MERCLYELKGIVEYYEQMILITGKIVIYNKPDDEKFYARGQIIETPGNKKYIVEGELIDMPEDHNIALDLMETPLNTEINNISYHVAKDYSKIKEREISIGGKYDGIRRDDVFENLFNNDSEPLEEKVNEMITSLTTAIDKKPKIVVMSLTYRGLVPPNFSFS